MILVTGATGNTGRAIVDGLLAAGASVRAMVRRTEQAGIFPAGVDVVVADMGRADSLPAAVEGIDQMLLISPLDPSLVEMQGRMTAVARSGGVRRIVKISTEIADPQSEALIGRWHGLAEREVEATGLAFFHLRSCNFMQNLYTFAAEIASSDSFASPLGAARISLVDVGDLAAVAVAALLKRELRNGFTVVTGDDRPTYPEFADLLSTELGRPIKHVPVAAQDVLKHFLVTGMPLWKANELVTMYAYLQDPLHTGTTDSVRHFTGRRARAFGDFVTEYAARLAAVQKPQG